MKEFHARKYILTVWILYQFVEYLFQFVLIDDEMLVTKDPLLSLQFETPKLFKSYQSETIYLTEPPFAKSAQVHRGPV